MVAANDGPALARDPVHDLRRERPPVDHSARDDHVVNLEVRQVFKYGFEGWQITVNIGQDGERGHAWVVLCRGDVGFNST